MITLSPQLAREIATHAESTYPDECVGLLFGHLEGERTLVVHVYPVENRWEGQVALSDENESQSRCDRFYLDPRDYLRADREARTQGFDIVGCYHSHPDHVPDPSARDLTGAQGVGGGAGFSFVIQSVRQGNATDVKSWLLQDGSTRFEQEELIIA